MDARTQATDCLIPERWLLQAAYCKRICLGGSKVTLTMLMLESIFSSSCLQDAHIYLGSRASLARAAHYHHDQDKSYRKKIRKILLAPGLTSSSTDGGGCSHSAYRCIDLRQGVPQLVHAQGRLLSPEAVLEVRNSLLESSNLRGATNLEKQLQGQAHISADAGRSLLTLLQVGSHARMGCSCQAIHCPKGMH